MVITFEILSSWMRIPDTWIKGALLYILFSAIADRPACFVADDSIPVVLYIVFILLTQIN
jgi:hypothetical protein